MVENKVHIFDDCLHPQIQDNIESFIEGLPYVMGHATTLIDPSLYKGYNNIYEQFMMECQLDPTSPFWGYSPLYLIPLITSLSILGHYNFNINNLLRVKANLQTKAYENTKNKYNMPHVDQQMKNLKNQIVVLYYVNNSDSITHTFQDSIFEGDVDFYEKIKNLSIDNKIESKKGRIVVFRGDKLHAGQHPTNSLIRNVINYNYLLDI